VNTPTHAIALCALGLERIVQAEIERIGLSPAGREPGRVRFELGEAPEAALMRANLCLRCAERVLVEAGRFHAENFDELFETVRALPWELYFRRDDKLVIERVRLHDSKLAAQTSVQSIAHKAVYDRLGRVFNLGRLPESGEARSLRIYIEADQCLVGLDCSGEALHRRGYRRATTEAPLKETVAAGMLFLSGWNRRIALLDPFCGSGTIAVEAALYAMDRAPGLGRAFALETMPFATADSLGAEVEAAKARVRRDVGFCIVGSDADPRALEAARANAALAGVAAGLEFRKGRAEDAVPAYETGYLLGNPPYGERLGSVEEAEALYGRMGEIAERFSGWGLGFIVNRPDFGDFFGYEAPKQHKIVNGAEEQWFNWYPPDAELVPSDAKIVDAEHRAGAATGGRAGPSRAGRVARDRERREAPPPAARRAGPPRRPWVGPDLPGWKRPARDEPADARDRPDWRGPKRPLGPDRTGWKKRQG